MTKNKIINITFVVSLITTILLLPISIVLLYKVQTYWASILPFSISFISILTFLYLLIVKIIVLKKHKMSFNLKNIFLTQEEIDVNLFTKKAAIFSFVLLFIILFYAIWSIYTCYDEFYNPPRNVPTSYQKSNITPGNPNDWTKYLEIFVVKVNFALGCSLVISSSVMLITLLSFFLWDKKTKKQNIKMNN